MIVHKLLDVFFRTLDTIDAVRDRVDRALGREPRPDPWAVTWPPEGADAEAPRSDAGGSTREAGQSGQGSSAGAKPSADVASGAARSQPKSAPARKTAERKATPEKTAAKKTGARKKSPGRKKSANSRRKGSVDRSGKDLGSSRSRAIENKLRDEGGQVICEDSAYAGKKVLARVLWALDAAEKAGSEMGLTNNDSAALLSSAAGIEVFATNIGRACRDHPELITESEPDGRSRRYRLTDAGREAAATLKTRAIA